MIRKLSVSVAALAAFGMAGAASAQSAPDSGTIDINLTVAEVVQVDVIDPSIDLTFNGLNPIDMASAPALPRARFDVMANANFDLTVEVPETWQASDILSGAGATFNQVKFSNGDDFIGGSLFVHGANNPNPTGIDGGWRWNSANENISIPFSSGTYELQLGGAFDPNLYGNSTNPNGTTSEVAPPGIYSTTATITASIP